MKNYIVWCLIISCSLNTHHATCAPSSHESSKQNQETFSCVSNAGAITRAISHLNTAPKHNRKTPLKTHIFKIILSAFESLQKSIELPEKNNTEYQQVLAQIKDTDGCRLTGLAGTFNPKICDVTRALRMSNIQPHPFQNAILLFGPPGTGKTTIAQAIAKQAGAKFISRSGPELESKWVGESAENVRTLFDEAKRLTSKGETVVLFIDEIDALSRQRTSSDTSAIHSQILNQLLTLITDHRKNSRLLIIFATNVIEVLDRALKSRVIQIKVDSPNEELCIKLFVHYLKPYKHNLENNIAQFAQYAVKAQLSCRDIENAIENAFDIGLRKGSQEILEDAVWAELKEKAEDRLREQAQHQQMVEDILAQRELMLKQLENQKQKEKIHALTIEKLKLQIQWYRQQLGASHHESSELDENQTIDERNFSDYC